MKAGSVPNTFLKSRELQAQLSKTLILLQTILKNSTLNSFTVFPRMFQNCVFPNSDTPSLTFLLHFKAGITFKTCIKQTKLVGKQLN